jgi:hypothetical protein
MPEQAYILDWTYVRETTGTTSQHGGDPTWLRAMYQHPDRQGQPGSYPEVAYEAKHDIYSLGVTLLEVFLWIPFLKCETHEDHTDPKKIKKICELF